MALSVSIVSPEEVLLEAEAKIVITRSSDGEIAFLSGHVPYIGVLSPHTVRIELTDGKKINLELESGFVEVSDNQITILSDSVGLEDNS